MKQNLWNNSATNIELETNIKEKKRMNEESHKYEKNYQK